MRVVSAAATIEAPIPVNKPTLGGTPVVGSTLTCTTGGFLNTPTSTQVQWLRAGTVISGAGTSSYVPVAADLGRQVQCKYIATNAAGSAEATSDGLVIVNPSTPGPAGPAGAKGDTPSVRVTCDLSVDGKTITCTITAVPPTNASAKLTGTARLAGCAKSTTKTGKGKVTMRLHSSKRLKKAPKVVLRIASGKSKTSLTVKAK